MESHSSMKCCVCGKGFRRFAALMKHEQSHPATENSSESCKIQTRTAPRGPSLLGRGTAVRSLKRTTLSHAPGKSQASVKQLARESVVGKRVTQESVVEMEGTSRGESGTKSSGKRQDRLRTRVNNNRGSQTDRQFSAEEISHGRTGSNAMKSNTTGRSVKTVVADGKNRIAKRNAQSQDPLKLSAIKMNFARKSKYNACKMDRGLSDAWDILSCPPDGQSDTCPLLSVKHSNSPHLKTEGSSVSSTFINCHDAPKTFVQRALFGVHLSDQEYERIVKISRMHGILSMLSENLTGSMRALQSLGNSESPREQGVSQTPFQPNMTDAVGTTNMSLRKEKHRENPRSDKDVIKNFDELDKESHKVQHNRDANKRKVSQGIGQRKQVEGKVSCDICNKEFADIKRHMLIHNSERTFACDQCGKAFYEKRVLVKHLTTHVKRFKCSVCDERFSKLRAARRHAKLHMAEKPYVCETCKSSFRTRRELRSHMFVHANIRRYMCDICGHRSRKLAGLRNHQRRHSGEKAFVCEICGKAFKYMSGLRTHSFAHTSGTPYRCRICSESFKHNYLLKRHLLTHEGEQPKEEPPNSFHHSQQSSGVDEEASSDSFQVQSCKGGSTTTKDSSVEACSSTVQTLVDRSLMPALSSAGEGSGGNIIKLQDMHNERSGKSQPSASCAGPSKFGTFSPLVKEGMSFLHADANNPQTAKSDHTMPLVQTTLGPDLLDQNLLYGAGSRAQTVESCLVETLCDGSFKALRQMQKEEEPSNIDN